MRAHMHSAHGAPRTRNCESRAHLLLLLLLLLLLSQACSSCYCCCCCTNPPWRTPTSRGHIRVTRGVEPRRALVRAPPCAHNCGTRALATAWSVADDSQLSERTSKRRCSESCQTWASSKGSSTTRVARQRNMRQRAPIRLRGRRRHKGACGGGERDWDGVFCDCPASPAPWGTPRRSAASAATRTRRSSAANCRRRPSSAYRRLQKVNLRQEVRDAGRKGREGNGAGGTAPVSTIRPIKNRSNRRRRSRSVWGS